MAFDYKKEYKEYYLPKSKPAIIEIPAMNDIAVRGKGGPRRCDFSKLKTVLRHPVKVF